MIEREYRRFYIYGYVNCYNNSRSFINNRGEESYVNRKIKETFDYFGLTTPKGNYQGVAGIISIIEIVLSIFVLIGRFLYLLVKRLFANHVAINGLHLVFPLTTASYRIKDMLRSLDNISICSVRIPFINNSFKRNEINELAVISYRDIFDSFVSAFLMVFYMRYKFGKKDILFRSYSSFEFFLTCRFVHKVEQNNEIVYYNNYDRWAFLFSRANTKVTFIQHGKLDYITRWIRVGCPNTAYYLSESQEIILQETLFTSPPKEVYYRKTLQFHNTEILNKTNGKLNVLIVSASSFINDTVQIVEMLAGRVNLYVKPHPGEKLLPIYSELVGKYSVQLLEKTDYPEADVVLSYNSTLADEYEIAGVRVIRWDLLKDLSEVKSLILRGSIKN